ncbi:uncharacterized protein PGRI_040590 [Penicillium griseofulvum]|uniref:Uncharacterized protein n=1 Tax=Penicillium patulum TaxID=5078 RepID=A0A135L9A4_PENPA|nr:uncharacterized protein PGRI_040590 [Penicillium griseofulvum]KXG45510.1 hypothetical protein PGRI_040590 [Penicillium griseofulvum]
MASTDVPLQPVQRSTSKDQSLTVRSNQMASPDTPQYSQIPSKNPAFAVNFTWKKWRAMVSDASNPGSEPLYTIHFPISLETHIIFKKSSDGEVIGNGKLNFVSINAEYELHGQKARLLAQKRWRTVYTHRSLNFSDTGSPVTMTWTSDAGFKNWDFVCVDEQQMPVAKFTANCWGLTNIGKIEFSGSKANDRAAQEEIIVTGITLFYCMVLRCNNLFNLFGAIFARPGQKQHIN